MPRIHTVFISSTSEDLKEYRQSARDAAISAGFHPQMMEYFTASGLHPPYRACMEKVAEADVLVAIVAHRYGWVPPDQPGNDHKSITWLECEEAARLGREVLAFVVDDHCEWPLQLKEAYRTTDAIEKGEDSPDLLAEVRRNVARLKEFKRWLNGLGIRATFTNPDDLRAKVEAALREWRPRRNAARAVPRRAPSDPTPYLHHLHEHTAWIDIRGLQVGAGKAYRFPIEDLYIPLTIPDEVSAAENPVLRKPVELEEALAHQRLVIVGDPGSGKTTFLRHVAFLWCRGLLDAGTGPQLLFPIYIRIPELVEHIQHCRRQARRPAAQDSPAWLIDFLHTRNQEMNWGLRPDFFREILSGGSGIVLLDGLDEAPGKRERESAARLFENATEAYRKCRFVVTTRPLAYAGESVLAGFHTVQIEPLETAAIVKFLEHWCRSLFPDDAGSARHYLDELSEALRARVEIRRMARNPVMLTALAVVHWNERRLPEQRADLYESILTWLARAREKRPGRESAERCLTLLQHLALAMQSHPAGRQAQVEKGWASDSLAPHFEQTPEAERRERALAFVEQEEVDSGIIASRGSDVRFWHLTFQEYLAARAIAGQPDSAQYSLLVDEGRIYRSEWREVVLLLAGVLRRQGRAKVDGLFSAVLDRLGERATLAAQARCAGLLGAIARDLQTLDYQPADPRYPEVLDAVLGIFDAQKAESIAFSERLEAAEALGQAGDPRLNEDNWVTVEAGEHVDAFQIGRYPVTVQEFRRFTDGDGYREQRWWPAGGFGKTTQPWDWEEQALHPNRPVAGVNWYEASAYCAWAGARLPTAEEWEHAACGYAGRLYPWGDEDPDPTRANFRLSGPQDVTPVGMYPAGATPEGIHDMAGNVWEWTADRDEQGEPLLKGGSYSFGSEHLNQKQWVRDAAGGQFSSVGFRAARSLPKP